MGLFGGSEASGYNCEQINALRDVINSTAQSAGTGIVEKLEQGIIVPMSTAWYAPEAIEFFQAFADDVKATGETITTVFDSFRSAVQQAGTMWAENTGGEAPNLAAIDNVELNLDVSAIQKDNAGTVELFESEANKVAGNLSSVESDIMDELKRLAGDLNAESAFIGHGQADAVQNCFEAVSGAVHKVFSSLTEGENSLEGQIKKWAEIYRERAESTAQAFDDAASQL